jgi:hypothetical protein
LVSDSLLQGSSLTRVWWGPWISWRGCPKTSLLHLAANFAWVLLLAGVFDLSFEAN